MKKILGLDLGVGSMGWALVNEAEKDNEVSSIVKLGVRPISFDNFVNTKTGKESKEPIKDFQNGRGISANAGCTQKKIARRNLQRYKLRRENLIEILKKYNFISDNSILSEHGNNTTFQTYHLRAKASTQQVTLHQLAQILLMINKKRGYKSSRKAKPQGDEGQLIDGMEVARRLYEENLTPGQLTYMLLQEGKNFIPDFYRSDLQAELDRIWDYQKQFYPDMLTDDFKRKIEGQGKENISKYFLAIYGVYTADNKGKDKRLQACEWRVDGLTKQLRAEEIAFVVRELSGAIKDSSGYLGAISDRSKELFFNKQTVGQFLMEQLAQNPHTRLKGQAFYRQDYLNEFEAIWETQAKYYDILTPELKSEIRDVIIFYQRKLKSQKGLISFCEFESRQIVITENGKEKIKINGSKVCPKSSPIFQEFRIWQVLNNIEVTDKQNISAKRFLNQEEKEILFDELSFKKSLKGTDALKLLFKNHKELELNIEILEGNRTQATLFEAYQKIIELSGHDKQNFQKMRSKDIFDVVKSVFGMLGYNTAILTFDSALEANTLEKQAFYQLWHLLYSFEADDQSNIGNEKLIQKLSDLYGFEKEYAHILANVSFQDGYGNLSTKAIRKILPFMREGHGYSMACSYAGYRHSKNSLTKEEKENKIYKDKLEILPKNSLRNPVVEKILNQMVNVINSIIDTYGKPDEIRIELARELKKNAKQREQMTKDINKAASDHEEYRKILKTQFGLSRVSRNDIIRYKLYDELKNNGYHTLYSNTYISPDKLFSKEFEIEHIIPQSRLFDDSFSNKTLELSSINKEKSNDTAYDYVSAKYGAEGLDRYKKRLETLYQQGVIKKTKYTKLMMPLSEIPEDFINRDLNDTQYIAKKAKEMLEELVKDVVSTTGSVTNRLREDWQLIDVMQELNWDKYYKLGLTEIIENRDGHQIKRITDWTKRNDHRHHAMDALTVAFTKRIFIQYLNTLNARSDKNSETYKIETKYLKRDSKGKLRFIPPIPLNDFRVEAKKHLENILVSIKAKNKVVTTNINKTKSKSGVKSEKQLTPRGQLHNETIYGSIQCPNVKKKKVGGRFDEAQIAQVTSERYREALLARLAAFGNDPKKAFTGKNALSKNPIYLDTDQMECVPEEVKTVDMETIYTIRKEINSDLKLDKVLDKGIRAILDARLKEYGNDAKMAFSNLDENPIWLNKDKGISIKRVTIRGIKNARPLHDKKDKDGNLILDKNGKKQPVDFINTGNNHHVAIYKDNEGKLQEVVVSFYEATMRANQKLPIVDKTYRQSEGWEFLFTMKQNEYFIFPNPNTGFDPHDIDLKDPDNYAEISPNLFRVQKLSTKDYVFRHHLETVLNDASALIGITHKHYKSPSLLSDIVKVRINHIGQIVDVGEY